MKYSENCAKKNEHTSETNIFGDIQDNISDLDTIKILIENIVSRWNPKQIWLFGSRARGDARTNSDWDIFVVAEDTTPEDEFDPLIAWQLREKSGVRADIFLCHNSDFQMSKNTPNTLSSCITSEGVLLYGN